MNRISVLIGTVAVAALVTVTTVDSADARGRRVSGQVETARGTSQVERTTNRTKGQRQQTTTVTGERGRSTTVTDTRTRDRDTRTATHERDRTFPDGSTRSVDATAQGDGNGNVTVNRSVTGRDGEVRSQTGAFTTTATDNGRSTTGTIETTNRGTIDYQRDVARGDNTRTVNATAGFEDGTTRTRSSTTTRDPSTGATTTTGVLTGRNGQSAATTIARTPTDTGATYSRDTTFSDGTSRAVDRTRTVNPDGSVTADRTATDRQGETHEQTGTFTVERTPGS